MQSRTAVLVTLQVEGFHRWPNAPHEVAYLSADHRHIFHVKAEKNVEHEDRDVEIITLKRQMHDYLTGRWGFPMGLGSMSCEMLARELLNAFGLTRCEVLEDGENGGVVYA